MTRSDVKLRPYHARVWSEPVIMELGSSGERGIIVPGEKEHSFRQFVKDTESYIPSNMRRRAAPRLPEISQPEIVRHYLRLCDETLGMASNIDIGGGTDTMKYSPLINEELCRLPQIAEVHPLQDEDTIQGTLEIMYKFRTMLCEISGLDEFCFQPGGGAHAIFTNACIIRKHHESHGQLDQRNEIITTLFSHPADAACPAVAGFKVITLYPDDDTGLPNVEALKSAISKHTAGMMITNPEDTGIFNPAIEEFVKIIHEAGGVCSYDQANANALLGITRAKEAGFDLCHFNIHKTFSSPHGSFGPACGAVGATKQFAEYLPVPIVTFRQKKYHLDYERPESIGKVRQFFGATQVIARAYAWTMSLGPEGLRKVAETSIMNTNYLKKQLLEILGITMAYPKSSIRLDNIRFSLEKMKAETGVGTADVARRMVDYGIQEYHTSHHPWIVPEPFTPEPCESYSKFDIDYWVEVIKAISEEAYTNPELVRKAPHNQSIARINEHTFNSPTSWAMTWRARLRKGK
jgi:glycine dehydrogenase subunit 2